MNTKLYEAHKEVSDAEEKAISKITKREASSLAEKIAADTATLYHQIKVSETWAEFYNIACVSKETITAEIEERKANDEFFDEFFGEPTEESVIEFFKEQRGNFKKIADKRKIQYDTLKKFVDEDEQVKKIYNEMLYKDNEYWRFIQSMD